MMLIRWSLQAVVLTALSLGVSTGARAEDNLLGVPQPDNPQHPGAVVLHGGGTVDDDMMERFVELAGGANAHIVIIPSAKFSPADYPGETDFLSILRSRYESWLKILTEKKVTNWQFVYTDDREDADDPDFVRPLETATGVWFSGGLQSRLKDRFVGTYPEQTRFQAALKEVLERGGAVGGTSAGMAALPEIMTVNESRATTSAPAEAVADHGFGLMKQAIVEQHFDGRNGRMERFTRLLRDTQQLDDLAGRAGAGANMTGLAVEERTALIVQGDQLQVMGEGFAHVFLKSQLDRVISWYELGNGESALLKRDDTGEEILQRQDALLAR